MIAFFAAKQSEIKYLEPFHWNFIMKKCKKNSRVFLIKTFVRFCRFFFSSPLWYVDVDERKKMMANVCCSKYVHDEKRKACLRVQYNANMTGAKQRWIETKLSRCIPYALQFYFPKLSTIHWAFENLLIIEVHRQQRWKENQIQTETLLWLLSRALSIFNWTSACNDNSNLDVFKWIEMKSNVQTTINQTK